MFKKMKIVVPVIAVLTLMLGLANIAHAKKGSHLSGVVNVNTASAEELALIPGIGESKANAIAEYRSTEKFASTEDLMKVKGIGQKLFDKIQEYVTVDGPTTAQMIKDVSLDTPTAGDQS